MEGRKRKASTDHSIDVTGPGVKRRTSYPVIQSPSDTAHLYGLTAQGVTCGMIPTNSQVPVNAQSAESQYRSAIYPSRSCFSNDTYTVGWICTTSTAYVAAQEFLDEEHGRPQFVRVHDTTDYALGRIQDHNVVMALISDPQDGSSSAATVARDMLHSFPNVNIGMMIGIAGGFPSQNNDIRLGDVVVSAARDGNGGVLQLDFGKRMQNKGLHMTGFLNQPPTFLRNAVSGFRADIERKGHRFEQIINGILECNPRLREKYQRPQSDADKLFKSDVVHGKDCTALCSSDPSLLERRTERAHENDNPAIHYGLIGSGNQTIKDAILRDMFSASRNVLCIETNAAGLMNHFPCLAVCGVCNYADTHSNEQWEGYAAMVAAAYAKSLLYRISPRK
ncbi:uncharacterized protein LDX57_001171 [Aspergillus melleus]|uniref:uncharacterized protein n=1 Tax=Aspergillus melleus TaxID=138277 RepID=UPI001E8D134D|nr:uncharacterized protein LDX57_001171 [Aspergillus melleus]KAH8423410.1 hypothetical protein LDX57_001171 [Aspergillus melleus]